ncbi:type II toxin-antitoxin system VapC family toxin, partial [Mesorhizobium sp. M1428]|uniref:type II toxin-antitoxin system VapC family toxin n=1 Tax=Mesorhizobium sp. M1428 TaxID=2957102 RepID=UPI00333DFB91
STGRTEDCTRPTRHNVELPLASREPSTEDIVAVSLQALCEFVWVLARQYQTEPENIAAAIRALLNTANVVVNRPAVEAGLSVLDAGGDFADGVLAFDGGWLGGETFVSFDRKAVKLLSAQGQSVQLLF